MYFWNSNVLHFTVEKLLKKPFQYKFLYNFTDPSYMIFSTIETLYNDENWKKCMENIDKNLKRVKTFDSGKLLFFELNQSKQKIQRKRKTLRTDITVFRRLCL